MALTTAGKWGPDSFVDRSGRPVVPSLVTVPAGYTATVDGLGNVTITGPPSDGIAVSVTAPDGTVTSYTLPVSAATAELGQIEDRMDVVEADLPTRATAASLQAEIDARVAQAATFYTKDKIDRGFSARKLLSGARDTDRLSRTHPTAQYIVRGVDPIGGLLYAHDATNGVIRQSADMGVTWSNAKGNPTNANLNTMGRIVRFGGHVYVIALDTAAGTYKMWRSPVAAGNDPFAWTEVRTLVAGYNTGVYANFCAGSQYMYYTDYGDPTGGPGIYRSADGTTWETVRAADATLRHGHAVAEDPDNAGHIWATMGDGVGATSVLLSNDHGATWTAVAPASGGWQAVDISFSDRFVWFAADSNSGSVWVMDRATKTPKWASTNWHHNIAVPGAGNRPGGYVFTDGATTSGSKTLTSATAAFTSRDAGRRIAGAGIIPNAYIAAHVNATTVTLSDNATATATGVTISMETERLRSNAYFGTVDPGTEVFYQATATGSTYGNKHALLRTMQPGSPVDLLYLPPEGPANVGQYAGNGEVFVFNGHLIWDRYIRPLGTLATV